MLYITYISLNIYIIYMLLTAQLERGQNEYWLREFVRRRAGARFDAIVLGEVPARQQLAVHYITSLCITSHRSARCPRGSSSR